MRAVRTLILSEEIIKFRLKSRPRGSLSDTSPEEGLGRSGRGEDEFDP